jgi:hypothetical protein
MNAAQITEAAGKGEISIFDLMRAVEAHPQYVFGTVWSWDDVDEQMEDGSDSRGEADRRGALLRAHSRALTKAFEAFVFESGYGWTDAVWDVLYETEQQDRVNAGGNA